MPVSKSSKKHQKSTIKKANVATPPAKASPSRAKVKQPRAKVAATPVNAAAARLNDAGHIVGSEAAYRRYLPIAQLLPKNSILPYRMDPVLAYHNAQQGLDAIAPYRAELRKALPLLDHKLVFDLSALCQAVLFAHRQAEEKPRSDGELGRLIDEGSKLRALLLSTADALALSGVVPAQAVAKIRSGKGFIDMAQDCIELSALYRKYPGATTQQKLVRSEQIERAGEVGTVLLGRLKPQGGRKKTATQRQSAEIRDRLATLLWQGHRELRRAGYWLWPDELEKHVPPLQTRRVVKAGKKATPSPAPAGDSRPVAG